MFGKNSEDDLSEKLNQSTSNLHQSSAPLDVIYVGQILEVIAAKEDIDLQVTLLSTLCMHLLHDHKYRFRYLLFHICPIVTDSKKCDERSR